MRFDRASTGFVVAALVCAVSFGQAPPPAKKVGILLFTGAQVIDFSGPFEVLSAARNSRGPIFEVSTVAETPSITAVSALSKLNVSPQFTFENAPKYDVLVVPGGQIKEVMASSKATDFIKGAASTADCVMSVCNGAYVLAHAGLLKNQKATTYFQFIGGLTQAEPTCTPIYDQRFVDNGKIVTTAGVSSGIDGALHLVERYGSRFDAEQTALILEYNWQPDLNYTRGNLGDRYLIEMLGPKGFEFGSLPLTDWTATMNTGTREQWTKKWTFKSDASREEILKVVDEKLTRSWKNDGSGWTFAGSDGKPWQVSRTLASTPEHLWSLEIQLRERS